MLPGFLDFNDSTVFWKGFSFGVLLFYFTVSALLCLLDWSLDEEGFALTLDQCNVSSNDLVVVIIVLTTVRVEKKRGQS